MTSGPTETPSSQKQPAFLAAQPDIAIEFQPGDVVGGTYEILDLLGQGGMGNIYRARHNIMIEEYALKTLRAENLTDVSWKRFQKEAQAIGRMNHPNIVAIYNFGLHDGKVPFYVMAQLQGKTLHDLVLANGPMPPHLAVPVFIEVCKGLGYAHKKGVIHRDIKPSNVVVLDQGQPGSRVKIVDFGIVKLSDDVNSSQQLTNIGEVCGSPYYMSPEQCEASPIDSRSDIYSAGCTFYEVLTGAPPFRGRNVVDTMLKHQSAIPATLKAASGGKQFPPLLESVVAKMLAKSPDNRYQTMEEVAGDLEMLMGGGSERQTRSPEAPQMAAQIEAMSSDKTVVIRAEAVAPTGHQLNPQHRPAPAAQSHAESSLAPPAVSEMELKPNFAGRTTPEDQERTLLIPKEKSARKTSAPATSLKYDAKTVSSSRVADQDGEDEANQPSLPPHFLRLMIGLFIATAVLLTALGCWWIQLKPGNSAPPQQENSTHPLSFQTGRSIKPLAPDLRA